MNQVAGAVLMAEKRDRPMIDLCIVFSWNISFN